MKAKISVPKPESQDIEVLTPLLICCIIEQQITYIFCWNAWIRITKWKM